MREVLFSFQKPVQVIRSIWHPVILENTVITLSSNSNQDGGFETKPDGI